MYFLKIIFKSQVQHQKPLILASGMMRQEDCKFKASLDFHTKTQKEAISKKIKTLLRVNWACVNGKPGFRDPTAGLAHWMLQSKPPGKRSRKSEKHCSKHV